MVFRDHPSEEEREGTRRRIGSIILCFLVECLCPMFVEVLISFGKTSGTQSPRVHQGTPSRR